MGPVVVCFLPVNEFTTTSTSGQGGTALAEARSHAAKVAHARARRKKAAYTRFSSVTPEQSLNDVPRSEDLCGNRDSEECKRYIPAGPEALIASKGLDPFLAVADNLSVSDSKQLAECREFLLGSGQFADGSRSAEACASNDIIPRKGWVLPYP
jgi:hypothetical protein